MLVSVAASHLVVALGFQQPLLQLLHLLRKLSVFLSGVSEQLS